jgi:hypothetical protein
VFAGVEKRLQKETRRCASLSSCSGLALVDFCVVIALSDDDANRRARVLLRDAM